MRGATSSFNYHDVDSMVSKYGDGLSVSNERKARHLTCDAGDHITLPRAFAALEPGPEAALEHSRD